MHPTKRHRKASHPARRDVPRAGRHAIITQLLQQATHYHQQGDLQQAAPLYHAVLQHDPRHVEALLGLGVLAGRTGDYGRAATLLRQAIALQQHAPLSHYNLGFVLMRQGDLVGAAAAYERALQLDPSFTEAYQNLGVVRQEQGLWEAAEAAYRTVLRLQPDYVAAYNNLGTVLKARGDLDAARAAYATAIRLRPDFAEAYNNMGLLWQEQHNLCAARTAYETAIRLKPQYAEAHHNLGAVFQELGDLDAALAAYETALHYDPHLARARWNRALVWLAQGNLVQGWPAYEWRLQTLPQPQGFPQPRWDGAALHGRTILVWAEQGVGDEILFASCVVDLVAQASHVVLACDPRLASLFGRTFPTATVCGTARDDLSWLAQAPPSDVYVPMGSLPLYLRPTLASFPAHRGYLVPDATLLGQYRQRLAALGTGLKVGIAWRSLAARRHDPAYTTLTQWRALLAVPGVHFVNLQYDQAEAEVAAAEASLGVRIHGWDDLDLFNDFDGVAALIAALDLIIGPETTVTALAGALGRPVWRLTGAAGGWTSLGTHASPWFPSMRVWRQRQYGRWDEPLAQMAQKLWRLVQEQG